VLFRGGAAVENLVYFKDQPYFLKQTNKEASIEPYAREVAVWQKRLEDPAFVERLAAAGIVFLGPPAAAMRRLGDKIEAKRLAEWLAVH
jgi:biotin carboxylase